MINTTARLLDAVEVPRPILTEDAERAEVERVPSPATYQAMYDAELFAMLAPRRYGGFELHPTECMRVWEAVARIDASAAWNLVMNQGIANYAAWLPEAGVEELFSNGIPTIAGALHPPAQARRVEGGWRITGQVPFGSGCHRAQWLAMPALEDGADAAFAVYFPKGIRHNIGYMAHHGDAWHWVHGLPSGRSFCPVSHDSAGGTVGQPRAWVQRPIVPYVALAEYPWRRNGVRRCRCLRARGRHRTL